MEQVINYLVNVYYCQGGYETCVFRSKEEAQEYAKERRLDDLFVSKITITTEVL